MIEGQEGLSWERWRHLCSDVEALGFASLRRSDHLVSLMGDDSRDCIDCWASLTVAAEWTKTIEFGPMVSPLTFYRPAVLEILDFVIASPHVKLRQEPAAMTARMLRAVSHPHVDLIGHPTGRRPGSREGASYDFEAVFRAAAENGVAVEIDCDPARMDLSPELARLAAECGCTFALSSDAHAPEEFAYVPMAAWMARRAGISADRIINWSIDNRFKEPSR